jgi:hypothetical protein
MDENKSLLYNLFISHSNLGNEEYERFIGKLEASHDFNWKNHTLIGKTSTGDLKLQITPVDVVIVLSGMYSADKDVIQRIIDIAVDLEKPIVIIRPYGMENVPGSIEEVSSEVVGWNTPCIVDAIRDSSPYDEFTD